MASNTPAAPTPSRPLVPVENPPSEPNPRINDIEGSSHGFEGLKGLVAAFQQQEASKCEEKGSYFGFDFNSGKPKAQGNSRFVWDVTIS